MYNKGTYIFAVEPSGRRAWTNHVARFGLIHPHEVLLVPSTPPPAWLQRVINKSPVLLKLYLPTPPVRKRRNRDKQGGEPRHCGVRMGRGLGATLLAAGCLGGLLAGWPPSVSGNVIGIDLGVDFMKVRSDSTPLERYRLDHLQGRGTVRPKIQPEREGSRAYLDNET